MHQEVLKHFRQRINELGQVALGQAQYPNTVPAQRERGQCHDAGSNAALSI